MIVSFLKTSFAEHSVIQQDHALIKITRQSLWQAQMQYTTQQLFQLMTDNIKIVVRVRPFNQNEVNQDCVIQMDDNQVKIRNPQTKQAKEFAFHRCYWSVDDSQGTPPVDNKFLFQDIGKQILEHTYNGYNSTIFAYGQTGSGKSYSIEGYAPEKGLLQMCCEDIFKNRMAINKTNGVSTTVHVSYLQIYNQKLRDLLNPGESQPKIMSGGDNMMIVQGLSSTLCQAYADVQKLFNDGKKIRVIGAHAMNKNSSRSHAVFTINYKEVGKGKLLQSKFNIVDLAGSERQSKTHATGQRLQQANNINKSLTNLGIVIEALATNCVKKQKNHVPYRNSQLTHLLSQSLGGNSKTFMIAAISPASSNYEQSLSTLRFAQRVASIQTVSKKNVQQKGNFNKELLNEIQRLKAELEKVQIINTNTNTHSHSHSVEYIKIEDQTKIRELQDQLRAMMAELSNNKGLLDDMEKKLEEQRMKKLEQEQNRNKALREAGLSTEGGYGGEEKKQDENMPYIMNISDDPTLAGMLLYKLKQGQIKVGTSEHEENDIKINALGMHKKHCTITRSGKDIFIEPGVQDGKVMVNGLVIKQKKKLKHLDRIMLGAANAFKLIIPGEKADINQSLIRFGEFIDDKLAAGTQQSKNIKAFLEQLQQRLDRDTFARFKEKFKNGLQGIDEANEITQMRYKKYPLKQRNLQFKLNIILDVNNYLHSQPQLIIECRHKQTKQVQFLWSDDKFQDRLDGMIEWYSDVDSKKQANQATYYQFDPWFEVTDNFMKERQTVDKMTPKEQLLHWLGKLKQVSKRYQNLIKEQKDLMSFFKNQGIKNEDQLEQYADFFFREFQTDPSREKSLKKLRENTQLHKSIRRFMQCCAEIQQCNIDNKEFSKRKNKYEAILTSPNQGQGQQNMGGNQPRGMNPQMQVHYLQKIEELKEEITKKIKIIKDYESKYQ